MAGLLWHLVPYIRAVAGTVVLAYVPGMLLLRLLGLGGFRWSVQLALETAVSLALVMLMGACMNGVYPLLGISGPLRQEPVVLTFGGLLLVLLALNLLLRREAGWNPLPRTSFPSCTVVMASCLAALAPLLALYAASVFTATGNNRPMVALFAGIIGLAWVLGGVRFRGLIGVYPLALMTVGLSLLLARTLVGQYIAGWDIQSEYFFAERTTRAGMWAVGNSSSQLNSTLSVVLLPTIFTQFTGLSTTWIFKLIFPLFLSLVPPVLYETYRRYVDEQQAFLATLFVIFLNVYYFALSQAIRMEIAFLFLALAVYLMLAEEYRSKHAALTVLFVLGLVVAHYSSAYIFVTWLVGAVLALMAGRPLAARWFRAPSDRLPVSFNLVLLALCSSYGWYAYTSGGITVREAVGVLRWSWQLLDQTFALSTHNVMILKAASGAALNPVDQAARYFYLATVALLAIGYVSVLLDRGCRMDLRYLAFATSAMVMLGASILLPAVSIAYDTGRMYLQSLVVLGPFFVLGTVRLLSMSGHVLSLGRLPRSVATRVGTAICALGIGLYLAFQVGLASTLAGYPSTYVLDRRSVEHDALYIRAPEVAATQWMHRSMPGTTVYADGSGWMRLWSYGLFPKDRVHPLPPNGLPIPDRSVLYLGSLNTEHDRVTVTDLAQSSMEERRLVLPRAGTASLATIYDAGGARVMVPVNGTAGQPVGGR